MEYLITLIQFHAVGSLRPLRILWSLTMKNEFKLIIKRDPNGSYEAIEYNESKDVLIERQKQLKQEQPAWEILVVKQNYNVS